MERKQITLRLPDKVYGALREISLETGLNVTVLLIISIWNSVLKPKRLFL